MNIPESKYDLLLKILAPLLTCASVFGIFLSTFAISVGLLGTWIVYIWPTPPPPPFIPATYTSRPTITPTYILPTFMGRQQIPAVPLFPHLVTPTKTLLPSTATLTVTASAISIELVSLTSPISINADATMTIKTLPGQECRITYITSPDHVSIAQGLDPVIADQNGHCTWTWNIGPNTKPGENTITIKVGNTTENFPIEIQTN